MWAHINAAQTLSHTYSFEGQARRSETRHRGRFRPWVWHVSSEFSGKKKKKSLFQPRRMFAHVKVSDQGNSSYSRHTHDITRPINNRHTHTFFHPWNRRGCIWPLPVSAAAHWLHHISTQCLGCCCRLHTGFFFLSASLHVCALSTHEHLLALCNHLCFSRTSARWTVLMNPAACRHFPPVWPVLLAFLR